MVLTYRYRLKTAPLQGHEARAEYTEVDERLTTQVCSGCGAVSGPKGNAGLRVREWVCAECGIRHDRDINSAVNILVSGRNVGLRVTEIPSDWGGEDVKGE